MKMGIAQVSGGILYCPKGIHSRVKLLCEDSYELGNVNKVFDFVHFVENDKMKYRFWGSIPAGIRARKVYNPQTI
jgi:hypothetical protein